MKLKLTPIEPIEGHLRKTNLGANICMDSVLPHCAMPVRRAREDCPVMKYFH